MLTPCSCADRTCQGLANQQRAAAIHRVEAELSRFETHLNNLLVAFRAGKLMLPERQIMYGHMANLRKKYESMLGMLGWKAENLGRMQAEHADLFTKVMAELDHFSVVILDVPLFYHHDKNYQGRALTIYVANLKNTFMNLKAVIEPRD